MNEFIALTALLTSTGTALLSGVRDLLHPRTARKVIRTQRLLPLVLEWPVVLGRAAVETGVGVLGVLVSFSGNTTVLRLTLWTATGIYLSYTGFALFLIRHRPGAPCGCAGSSDQANAWTVARGALLGGLSVLSLIGLGDLVTSDMETVLTQALFASVALGAVIWQLPVALNVPTIDRGIQPAGDQA